MKLIIDIDKEQYEEIIKNDYIYSLGESDLVQLENKIYNGKPLQAELEEIKAELQTEKDKSNNTYYAMKSVGLSTAIKIIDRRIKELNND